MNDIKKHALALFIIAILLYFKFILVPVLEWQDTKLLKLALLERKINRVEQLLTNQMSIEELDNDLNKHLNRLNHNFFQPQPIEEFKLQQQKLIEEELASLGLNVNSIGWKNNQNLDNASLTQFQVDIGFSGKSEQVIEYLLSVSSHVPISEVMVMNLSFQRQQMGQLGSLRARIRLAYYMQVGMAQ